MLNFLYIIAIIGSLALSPAADFSQGGATVHLSQPIASEAQIVEATVPAVEQNEMPKVPRKNANPDFRQELKNFGLVLHPGSEFSSKEKASSVEKLNSCAKLSFLTLKRLPEKIRRNLKDFTLHFDNTARRGLGGGGTIILRCSDVSDQELVSVLVHEMGHVSDANQLTGNIWSGTSEFMDGANPVYKNDPSLNFYRISFLNETTAVEASHPEDFVSGYSLTDPFEDFAETFNFYFLHGSEFREKIKLNSALENKYQFMKDEVFDGLEFGFDQPSSSIDLSQRPYDTTLLAFNFKNFIDF